MANLTRCSKCGIWLIDEEKDNHECRTVTNYKIKGNILWVYDGERWYPRKLETVTDEYLQHNESDEDFTEPSIKMFIFFIKILLIYLTIKP